MIGYRDIKNLKYHAREFAMMMDTEDIEAVIAEFVAAKNFRDSRRNHDPK
jgi:hypothetical protein